MYMVQRRERLKKQLLVNQLELIKLQATEKLVSANSNGDDTHLEVVRVEEGEEREELESVEDDEPCSPPSIRQTR